MTTRDDWPADEIKRLAQGSGKPLEVECAMAFLAERWLPRLGCYYRNNRELDVLATREEHLKESGIICRVRVVVSCRGFPAKHAPLAYSVSDGCVPALPPSFLAEHRWSSATSRSTHGALVDIEHQVAQWTIGHAQMGTQRPLVAFDLAERNKGKDPEFKLLGDRSYYPSLDSAVQAAFHWSAEDYNTNGSFATLCVPVCLLSIPFWDVCINDGVVNDVVPRSLGFQTNSYPGRHASNNRCNVTVLVYSREKLGELLSTLDTTFINFRNLIEKQSSDWKLTT